MNKMKKRLQEIASFMLALLIIFALLWLIFPKSGDRFATQNNKNLTEKQWNYVALGDSLTEGVGDVTKQGGFVSLLAKKIESEEEARLTVKNFGKAGDTSTQIYERMSKQEEIRSSLKKADIITLTLGGNDVMKVFRENFDKISNLSAKDFLEPEYDYQKQLKTIFSKIREENASAQIYVLGIYNPFYLNFPEITEMQKVINNWNSATQEVVQAEKNTYFVPINDLLYKGLDGKGAIEDSDKGSSSSSKNNLLYVGDNFHPNNTGYQIMANAVFSEYNRVNHK